MQSFGERLRHERETRNTTIEQIASATGIHRGFLEALEKNEFQSLPGRAFGKFYLRAYAEVLEFDPEPLIVHYDRERLREPPEPLERRPDEPALRRVEASLAKWRASHGGHKVVGRVAVEDNPAPVSDSPAFPPEQLPDPQEEIADIEVAVAGPPPTSELPTFPPEQLPDPQEEIADIEVAVAGPPPISELPTFPPEQPPDLQEETADVEIAVPVHAVGEAFAIGAKPQPVSDLPVAAARRSHKLAATVGGVGLLVALYLAFRPSPPPAQPSASAATAPVPEVADSVPDSVATPPQVAAPPPVKPAKTARTSKPSAVTASPLTVSDFGVGRSDETARVEVPAEPFREGDVVAFSTRVRGGRAWQSIRHVWLHRGRAVQSIRLRVGAADWRTHSTKTLWGAGPWSVEARDEAGNVLARAAFECVRR